MLLASLVSDDYLRREDMDGPRVQLLSDLGPNPRCVYARRGERILVLDLEHGPTRPNDIVRPADCVGCQEVPAPVSAPSHRTHVRPENTTRNRGTEVLKTERTHTLQVVLHRHGTRSPFRAMDRPVDLSPSVSIMPVVAWIRAQRPSRATQWRVTCT